MVKPVSQSCPACHGDAMAVFHEQPRVPANSCILLDDPQAAGDYPQGRIALGCCADCGFISNTAFDPALTEYSGRYEETQGFSATFNAFHQRLAADLVQRYQLQQKKIIEIGCGKGEFLALLCQLGDNQGLGFDPGVKVERLDDTAAGRMQVIADFYSERYAAHQADFLVCKMTLEHIHPVGEFVATLRRAIGDRVGTPVFFQVPDTTRILRDCAFEDIYYEHCSYFTPGSLARLFRANGFEVLRLAREYGDQYLTLEARASSAGTGAVLPDEESPEALGALVAQFGERVTAKHREWAERLQAASRAGSRVVIWGAASKAVALLSALPGSDVIRYGVDINPHRQGHYLPGSGLAVVAPSFLADYRPDLVIVMNPLYRDEIQGSLRQMTLDPEIVTL